MIIKILTLSLILTACAEERSDEDRTRETVERTVQRMRLAESNFIGAIRDEKSEGFIPVRMNTQTLYNPDGDGDKPVIQAELTLGLFGGVSLRSTQTSYDFGNRRLVAHFTDKSSQAAADERAIEWRSTVEDGKISDAQLITSVGIFDLIEDKSFNIAFPTTTDRTYQFVMQHRAGQGNFLAKLTLENLSEDEIAPPGYSVPRIPKLRAALRFTGTGIVPQNADRTIYDPLRGTIELFYPGAARIVLEDIFLKNSGLTLKEDLEKRDIIGTLYRGAEYQSRVTLAPMKETQLVQETSLDLPPEKFFGIYKSTKGGLEWEVSMRIEYVGDIGINNENLTFRQFPQLKLTMYRCIGPGQWLSRKYYSLKSIDYIRNRARFTLINASSSGEYDLVLNYSSGWKTLLGYYLDGDATANTSKENEGNWEFMLKADAKSFDSSCTK